MLVPHAEPVLFADLLILVLQFLLLFFAHRLALFRLLFEVGGHVRELTFSQIFDQFSFALTHRFAPIGQEIRVEHFFRRVIVIEHPRVEGHYLFGGIFQFHFAAIVEELHIGRQRLVARGKQRTFVFERRPFPSIGVLLFFPPKAAGEREREDGSQMFIYHRQTSSSSSFFFRLPLVSLVGVEFGVTFSFFTFFVDFFSFFTTTTGVFELDLRCAAAAAAFFTFFA